MQVVLVATEEAPLSKAQLSEIALEDVEGKAATLLVLVLMLNLGEPVEVLAALAVPLVKLVEVRYLVLVGEAVLVVLVALRLVRRVEHGVHIP